MAAELGIVLSARLDEAGLCQQHLLTLKGSQTWDASLLEYMCGARQESINFVKCGAVQHRTSLTLPGSFWEDLQGLWEHQGIAGRSP